MDRSLTLCALRWSCLAICFLAPLGAQLRGGLLGLCSIGYYTATLLLAGYEFAIYSRIERPIGSVVLAVYCGVYLEEMKGFLLICACIQYFGVWLRLYSDLITQQYKHSLVHRETGKAVGDYIVDCFSDVTAI